MVHSAGWLVSVLPRGPCSWPLLVMPPAGCRSAVGRDFITPCVAATSSALRPADSHRNRPPGAEVRLAFARVLLANPRVADADPLGAHVDVLPAQARVALIAAARSTRRRGSRAAGPARARRCRPTWSGIAAITASSSGRVRNCRSGSASPSRRRRGRAARATGFGRPPTLHGEREDGVQERHHVADRLRRRAPASIARASRSTSSAHGVHALLAERRRDVDALHRLAVLAMRQPGALDRPGDPEDRRRPHRRSAALLWSALDEPLRLHQAP